MAQFTVLVLGLLTLIVVAHADEREPAAGLGNGPLELQWETDVGRSVVYTPILIPGGLLTVSTDRKLYRHDLETGRKRWKRRFKHEIGARPIYGELASGEDRVFVYTGRGNGGRLRAVRGENGKDVWVRTLTHRPISLAWIGDALWVLDISGRLSRLDPEDGRSTWSAGDLGWDPPPLLAELERIYVLSREDSLRAFSTLPREVDSETDPEDGAVEIDQVWSTAVSGRFAAPPVRIGERLFVCSTEGQFQQVDSRTGQVLQSESRRADQLFAAIDTGNGILTVSSDGHAELQGAAHRWSYDLNSAISARPVAADRVVLFATSVGELVALHTETGTLAWRMEMEHRLRAAPILTPRYLVLATNRGDLFVYDHQ